MTTTQDDPSLQPTDAAGFDRQIEALRAQSDHIGLPGITIAMWPSRVCFSDDVSDTRMFNECYIEPDFIRGQCSMIMYCFALMHHLSLVIIVLAFIKSHGDIIETLFRAGAIYAFFLSYMDLSFGLQL
ncbi:hypothetical protein [Burkholderia cepacia]|uniref:hypothetical protein n=1 Tax=Burkholderia cepacia TaxID=292 RepID=UPI002655CB58|nr:hypothetical protein [Burkholderia cepacia]MDN7638775.1 hypothetical protein [Burkholderia cepacia]